MGGGCGGWAAMPNLRSVSGAAHSGAPRVAFLKRRDQAQKSIRWLEKSRDLFAHRMRREPGELECQTCQESSGQLSGNGYRRNEMSLTECFAACRSATLPT